MRLDKTHLDQFEDIAPRTLDTLSLPVTGKEGVCVRVSRSPFNDTATRQDVLEVAAALAILVPSNTELQSAIDEAREALIKDSNDAEHDALVSLMEALGQTIPERGEWSGSCCPTDPDNCWIDDKTGEHVNAKTNERTKQHPKVGAK